LRSIDLYQATQPLLAYDLHFIDGELIMPKRLALMFAAGLAITATSFDARAMPSSPAGLTRQQNDVTLVQQGCGGRYHWNHRLKRCVRN
jgi:hypothetical protein